MNGFEDERLFVDFQIELFPFGWFANAFCKLIKRIKKFKLCDVNLKCNEEDIVGENVILQCIEIKDIVH